VKVAARRATPHLASPGAHPLRRDGARARRQNKWNRGATIGGSRRPIARRRWRRVSASGNNRTIVMAG